MGTAITSSVQICNIALLRLGADTISSLSGSDRASIVCNNLYNVLRDEVMGESPWRFATTRATLAPNGTTPAFDFDYEYNIPSDCLRLLVPDDDKIVWVQEGSLILTDEPTLNMKYIYRNTDESSWDERFCIALSWRLSMELALSLTQSVPMYQEMAKGYVKALAEARSMNAVIGTLPPLEADIWSDARKGNKPFRRTVGQIT